jgi:hypothetical protein
MDNGSFQGDLRETPFSGVLALIRRDEKTGRLRVRKDQIERVFAFSHGLLDIKKDTFDEPGFLTWLAARGMAAPAGLERAKAAAEDAGLVRALIDLGIFPAIRLWELMKAFFEEGMFPLFNWEQAEFSFEPIDSGQSPSLIQGLSLSRIIMEGVRRMGNFAVIERHLPPPEEAILALTGRAADPAELASHEKYVLSAVERPINIEEICASSELGARETKRVLFALLAAGFIGSAQAGMKNARTGLEYSLGDMDRLFGVFNDRFAYLYRFVSKELGPVAPHIIEKSLDEIRDRIDPVFHDCEVKSDGRIELRSLPRKNLGVSSDDGKRSLLRSFDEILAAEVLAVKRTLGNGHEAALVKGMERIGDLK